MLVFSTISPQMGIAFANTENQTTNTLEGSIGTEAAKKEVTQLLVKYKANVQKDELKAKALSELNLIRITSLKFYKMSEIELI